MTSRLSAVVLCRDDLHGLRECLESLSHQKHLSEIVVVDGYSTDGSYEYANEHANTVIQERGFGRARVRGILEAKHDSIMSCDSDSIYPPHYSEVAEEILSYWTAGTGPVYPKDPDVPGAKIESSFSSFPKGFVYEHNCVIDRDAFVRAGLDCLPYFSYFDIGYAVGLGMDPIFDRRLWCKTRLPTRFLSVPAKLAEIWGEVFKAGLEVGKKVTGFDVLTATFKYL